MNSPDRSSFGYTVADITRLLRRVFDRRSAHLGLTRAQWRALSRLERAQGATQAELAEDLDLEPIAVGRVVDRLEAAGFIERRADPDDRRCWRLFLAGKSNAVMAEMKKIAVVMQDDVLAGLEAEQFAVAMKVLSRVKDTLSELDRGGRAPAPSNRKKP